MRQAYDYWQDQPGSCHTSHAAGCSLSKATDTGERNPAAGAARLDVRCIGMEGIHPHAGPCPLVSTARTAFRLCSTEHPTQAPSTLRNAGTFATKVREFPSAGLWRWQPTAPNKPIREDELFRRSRRPSRVSLGFQSGLHIVYRHKLPAPRSRTPLLERSRTNGRRIFRKWLPEHPDGQALKRASGLARPSDALTPPDRAPPRPTVTHHPRRGRPSASCSDAPAASLLVSSSTADWSPTSPSSGLASRF